MLNLVANGSSGYNLTRSLRFRSSASAYLNRTPTVAGNRKTWTWSAWVKRGALSVGQAIFTGNSALTANGYFSFYFTTSDTINFGDWATNWAVTTQVFRDPSAWYHIVVAVDTTQATASNRLKVYVNGSQITAFSSTSYPAQNFDTGVNTTGTHYISTYNASTFPFDGYLAEVNFIDGQALTPSSFGSTSSTTGVWQPARYTGTYGTNGFYLPFTDNSALTTSSNAGLGKDFSGNTNYFTTNNISITAGTTYDSMTDVPTLTSATASNFAVLNPLASGTAPIDGNLKFNGAVTGTRGSIAFPSSGLYYVELLMGSTATNATAFGFGLATASVATNSILYAVANAWIIYGVNATSFSRNGTATSSSFAQITSGTYLQLAVDIANSRAWIGFNNVWADGSNGTTGNPSAGTNPTFTSLPSELFLAIYGDSGQSCNVNFGQRAWNYTAPSGYVALNTYNLPTPTIIQGNKYMDATLYTGNTTTVTATNAGAFKPDLVWIKDRTGVASHVLTDSVRGVTKQLFSNLTNAEQTDSNYVTSFNSNGFTVGTGGSGTGVVNNSGDTFVGWQWQAGQGTTSSGTGTGGITSVTQSVNTTAGFSIVTYTGSGANGTVTHGLGVAPSMIIVKSRTSAGDEWCVWHTSLTNATYYLYLNATSAQAVDTTFWNSTAPTSSVINLGSNVRTNRSTGNFVCYAFAAISGYSKFGSYTGNGSADGSFIFTNFRPKFVLIRRSDAVASWFIHDTTRNTYNTTTLNLYPNLSAAEEVQTTYSFDILSNGFKVRGTSTEINASGGTYIYMAFAESPTKYSNSR